MHFEFNPSKIYTLRREMFILDVTFFDLPDIAAVLKLWFQVLYSLMLDDNILIVNVIPVWQYAAQWRGELVDHYLHEFPFSSFSLHNSYLYLHYLARIIIQEYVYVYTIHNFSLLVLPWTWPWMFEINHHWIKFDCSGLTTGFICD